MAIFRAYSLHARGRAPAKLRESSGLELERSIPPRWSPGPTRFRVRFASPTFSTSENIAHTWHPPDLTFASLLSLQRTSVVSSSVERNGRAIQKQPRHDRAQRAHHKEGEVLAELRTGLERWDEVLPIASNSVHSRLSRCIVYVILFCILHDRS